HGEANACPVINLVGDIRTEIAQRIVGQSRQMDDGIEPREIADIDVANILANMRHVEDVAAGGKRAAFVEMAIETDNLIARLQQHRNHDGSDVAQMSCYQYTHNYLSIT